MLQRVLKIMLVVGVLGIVAQEVQAGRHHGWGCGPHGCSYGGYAGCGPWGCGHAGWGSGGWYGGYAGYVAPGAYLGASRVAPSTARPLVNATQSIGNSVVLSVNVPADAKVVVNGHTTKSTGEARQFSSTGLLPGAVYRYQVRAEFLRDGKPVTEEQTVDLTTGESRSIAFKAVNPAAPQAAVAEVANTP